MYVTIGITVGSARFIDQAYWWWCLFTDSPFKWPDTDHFQCRCTHRGRKWRSRILVTVCCHLQFTLHASGQTVEAVEQLVYLGSSIDSGGQSTQEVDRQISIASSIMGRLSNEWQQSRLSLVATKLRVYNSLVLSVLLYGCEKWTILKSVERKLEAFHLSCQRRIVRIRWFDHVTNAEVRTGISSVTFEDGTWRSLDYQRRRQAEWQCDWQSTHEQNGVPITTHTMEASIWVTETRLDPCSGDRHGNLLMLYETLPSTVADGGHYDPSWSSMTDDDDDDEVKCNIEYFSNLPLMCLLVSLYYTYLSVCSLSLIVICLCFFHLWRNVSEWGKHTRN